MCTLLEKLHCSTDCQAHGKSINQRWAISSASGQTSWPDKYLVSHMAEMHGKWPMAACYF